MKQKIKLMSDEEVKDFLIKECRFNATSNLFVHMLVAGQKIADECEKQAFEKLKEVAKWFFMNITQTETSLIFLSDSANNHFEQMFQQYLKEQTLTEPPSIDNVQGFLDVIEGNKNQKAINLLNEWKERDGSEINKTYEDLLKEQDEGQNSD